jgi:hypothetical protein
MVTANLSRPEHRWLTTAESADTVAGEIHQLAAFTVRRDVTISWRDGTRAGVEFSFVYGGDARLVNLQPLWAAVRRLRAAGVWLEVYDVDVSVLRNVPG